MSRRQLKVGGDRHVTLPSAYRQARRPLVEVRLQHPEMLIARDATIVLLRLPERHRRPPHRHLLALPATHPIRVLANPRVRRVDDVRRRQAAAQRLRQAKAIDREQLREPLAQAGRRRRPLPLQPRRILLQLPDALIGVQLPGPPAASNAPARAAPSADDPTRSVPCDFYSVAPGSTTRTPGRWPAAAPWHRR